MNIQSSRFQRPQIAYNNSQSNQTEATQAEAPQDSFTFGLDGGDIATGAVVGLIGIAGAAMGAAAGNYEGAIAGIAGAVVGASAGASLAVHLPGEKVGTGVFLGALGGGIVASSFGNTGTAAVLGLAGASLPYGGIVGIATMIGGG